MSSAPTRAQLNFRLLRTVRDLALEGLTAEELAATQALHRQWLAGAPAGQRTMIWSRTFANIWTTTSRPFERPWRAGTASTLAELTLILSQFWQFVDGQGPGLRWIGRGVGCRRAQRRGTGASAGPAGRPRAASRSGSCAGRHRAGHLDSRGDRRSAPAVTALSVRAWELYAQGRGDEASAACRSRGGCRQKWGGGSVGHGVGHGGPDPRRQRTIRRGDHGHR